MPLLLASSFESYFERSKSGRFTVEMLTLTVLSAVLQEMLSISELANAEGAIVSAMANDTIDFILFPRFRIRSRGDDILGGRRNKEVEQIWIFRSFFKRHIRRKYTVPGK